MIHSQLEVKWWRTHISAATLIATDQVQASSLQTFKGPYHVQYCRLAIRIHTCVGTTVNTYLDSADQKFIKFLRCFKNMSTIKITQRQKQF